jgi:hypothetical protein
MLRCAYKIDSIIERIFVVVIDQYDEDSFHTYREAFENDWIGVRDVIK